MYLSPIPYDWISEAIYVPVKYTAAAFEDIGCFDVIFRNMHQGIVSTAATDNR
jgi:hypothetical protein